MRWYNLMGLIGVAMFILFFINQSFTDYTAGILQYNGFIPQGWDVFMLVVSVFIFLIWMGASFKSEVDRKKP